MTQLSGTLIKKNTEPPTSPSSTFKKIYFLNIAPKPLLSLTAQLSYSMKEMLISLDEDPLYCQKVRQ
jgi:hypothetical protein